MIFLFPTPRSEDPDPDNISRNLREAQAVQALRWGRVRGGANREGAPQTIGILW